MFSYLAREQEENDQRGGNEKEKTKVERSKWKMYGKGGEERVKM